jgi:hypothetical protein
MERLSANILICLFDGILQAVDLHLKPETMHFGVDKDKAKFYKKLKDLSDRPIARSVDPLPWKKQGSRVIDRVIDITKLADDIKNALTGDIKLKLQPAEFALQMIESANKVKFRF